MCDFITIAVPADKAKLLEDAIPRGIQALAVSNASIRRQIGAGYRRYALVSGGCSCDLYRSPNDPIDTADEIEKRRRKYQKKGWSQAKIERAIASCSRRDLERDAFAGLRPDVRSLVADVAEQASELAIIVHWYSGDVETEKIALRRTHAISPADLRAADASIDLDELVWIRQGIRRQ
jgi:hypothetical protein